MQLPTRLTTGHLVVVSVVVTSTGVVACTPAPTTTSDCQGRIRTGGVTYTAYAYTESAAVEHGPAVEAECRDNGPGSAGSIFTKSSHRLTTWAFPGHDPAMVLGLRYPADGSKVAYSVYVAETLSQDQIDRVRRDLK